ncbi:hypothetical protein BSU04_01905 [Caballeronia sordidicola]|uniref:Uncharacterized protein n=1 Tax=Caballeronia sordidicola TaxID=196367 RepID=A0A226XBE0_CABSO|nr:hypothetical protein BSU04_01905 [Caballeronia sordidicola]
MQLLPSLADATVSMSDMSLKCKCHMVDEKLRCIVSGL